VIGFSGAVVGSAVGSWPAWEGVVAGRDLD